MGGPNYDFIESSFKKHLMSRKIAIIGGGNLGTAIAEGLLKSKFSLAKDIIITKRNTSTLAAFKQKKITVMDNNSNAVMQSELIILAVKPFQVKDVLEGIKDQLSPQHMLV